jgi:hypothetical protein
MRIFLTAMAMPFVLLIMLLPSIPITRWVKRKMKDGKLKRALLYRWH